MGRTVDDVALLLGVLAAPDGRDPLHRPIDLPGSCGRRLGRSRAAWSAGSRCRRASQLDVLAGTRQAMVDLGWDVVDAEPELALADQCFRVLRAWNIANGPTAPFHDRMGEIKATIQDEIRRGMAVSRHRWPRPTPSSPSSGGRPSPSSIGLRRARLPRHPGVAVRLRDGIPARRRRRPASNYIDWMASCWRITVTGCPTLSLPAGFDTDDLPVEVRSSPARAPTSNCCASPRRSRRRPGSPPALRPCSRRPKRRE